jgi:hypothetical protein
MTTTSVLPRLGLQSSKRHFHEISFTHNYICEVTSFQNNRLPAVLTGSEGIFNILNTKTQKAKQSTPTTDVA